MAVKSVFRRFFKILLIVIGIHGIVILGLHIWFVNNARGVLREIVSEKSGGKLKLKLSKLSFDFFSNKLQIREADLESTDTINQPASYHVTFRKLTLRIHSFWPLVLQKRLLLDSIKLHDPIIQVLLWKKDTMSARGDEDLSVPQEMGKLYNSMLDVLEGFGIKRIIINNATLSLVNKTKPGSKPVNITNVYLEVLRSGNRQYKRDDFVDKEQTVDLRTTHQNISLPGGRHQLAFKTFNLHLFRRYIELDSCTITAIPTERFKSSYTIFFSKLLLIGVDFNAMYRDNLIRADSVYCENPLFDINLIPTSIASEKKERPDPEKIVRELTGDLDLAFVGVKDAGIRINIGGTKQRSLFNSNKDNFEMRGLRVTADSSEPVTVQQFDMLVRDYRLYNEDSSTAYSFDSVKFKNNKIVLNNFSVTTTSGRYTPRSHRDYRIPYFELTGLDWYQLVFDETLKAREAVLYHPVINYARNPGSVRKKKMNFFTSLQSIDNLVTLDKINIIEGQINMTLGPSVSLNFQDVNLSLYSDQLLKSTNKEGVRRAVDRLDFSKGILKLNDITAQLTNTRYTDSNLVHSDKIFIKSSTNRINAEISDIYIANMLMDDELETVIVDGLRWNNATISLRPFPITKKSKRLSDIEVRNVDANNTRLVYSKENTSMSSFVERLQIECISKKGDQPLHVQNLLVKGNKLLVNTGETTLTIGDYMVQDNTSSVVSEMELQRVRANDTMMMKSPRVLFTTDINKALSGDLYLENFEAESLDLNISKRVTEVVDTTIAFPASSLRIDRVTLNQPAIHFAAYRNDSVTTIDIPRSEKSVLLASAISLNSEGVKLSKLAFNTNAVTIRKPNGEELGVEKGEVKVTASEMQFTARDRKLYWSGSIDSLYVNNPRDMLFGKNKNKLVLDHVMLGNLQLTSDYMADFKQLVKYNISAWLQSGSGEYVDSTTTLKWYNAGYDNKSKSLSLDSFSYTPTQARDSIIAKTPYQTDYITFKSGNIKLTDFNVESYRADTSLIANTVEVSNPIITIYRDKQPPLRTGFIKPLPVNSIKRIAIPVSISTLNVRGGALTYVEKNAKTRAEATIYLTDINGGLSNIKNRNLAGYDSLSIYLNGYLLDSAFIDLRVRQSYLDTLSGFLMTLRMKPTSLSFINPVLTPLSNVIITSGSVDSLNLRAIGREYIALGEMNMYYHNLRVKFVKPGSPEKTTLKTRILSSIANGFVIKKNNRGRTGLVYFERLRDRSFFNYIVKMTLSGISTSVGFKKNKKFRKKYEQELQNRNLPPVIL